MKPTATLFLAIILIASQNAFGQWTEFNTIGERSIETFNFLNDDLGYTLMRDQNDITIMKTDDGGENWIEISSPVQSGELQDIYFYEDQVGVVAVRDLSNDVTPSMLFHTTDDGANWENISPSATATGVGVSQCQFLNEDIGFFATDKFLYATTDGGGNWTTTEFEAYILSIDFFDAEHGILGTWDGTFNYRGSMLTTSDGGLNWNTNLLTENYTSVGKVQQLSTNIALATPIRSWAAANTSGQIYKTTDNGASWTTIEIPTSEDGYTTRQFHFKNEMNGVVCVENMSVAGVEAEIHQTTDGGQSWTAEGMVTSPGDMEIQLTPNSGYITGATGSFYKRSSSTAVKELSKEIDLKLFPSPAKSGQAISWHSPETFTQLQIIDTKGAIVHRQMINSNQLELPLLSAGIYYIQLLNDQVLVNKKLVIK